MQYLEDPFVSVVVPVKNRPEPTKRLVESFLDQTYSNSELIIVGDFNDATWSTVEEFLSERVRIIRARVLSEGRDANAKRNVGLEAAKGDVLVLTDSDVVLPSDWLETGVRLMGEGYEVVAGGLLSVGDGNFLSGYVDQNPLGAKTCRFDPPYVLTAENAGKGRYKQPITANIFLTRRVYEEVGGLDADFTTPYEDYPYADSIIWGGILSSARVSSMYGIHTEIARLILRKSTGGLVSGVQTTSCVMANLILLKRACGN